MNATPTDMVRLHGEVTALQRQGCRFVTMTCVDLGEEFDVLYHFDLHYELKTLRVKLPKGQPLPSISHLCFAATIVENEIKDLFGLEITGLAVDYQGRFLLSEDAPKAPLNRNCGMGVEVRVKSPGPAEGSAPA